MLVEVLYFDGCPGHERVLPTVRILAGRVGAEVALRRVETTEEAAATAFLGSPTVRVNGVDVEPGAATRTDYGLKCRLYRTPDGLSGLPTETWMSDAITGGTGTDDPGAGPEDLGGALGSPDRWPANRLAGLGHPERLVYEAVLSGFTQGRVPSAQELVDLGGRGDSLRTLVERDLVQLADDGEVALAYPFSARPTRHQVRLHDGRLYWAMCAVDALGIPFLVHESAEVESREPGADRTISVSVDPAAEAPRWSPADAAVVAASSGAGCSSARACPHINLFASREAARRYLDQPELDGTLLTVPEATHAGRRLFGDLLDRLAELAAH